MHTNTVDESIKTLVNLVNGVPKQLQYGQHKKEAFVKSSAGGADKKVSILDWNC